MYMTGDVLKVSRGLYDHYSTVLIGGDFHRARVVEIDQNRPTRLSTLAEFAEGGTIEIVERGKADEMTLVVVRAAEVLLRSREYDLFEWNCEHSARYIAFGKAHSTQVAAGVAAVLGVLFGAVSALVYGVQRPTWDHLSGRYRSVDGRFAETPFL